MCFSNYIYTEHPKAPAVTISNVGPNSISLSWEVMVTCFESVNFSMSISWRSVSVEKQATTVSGNSYDISSLIPGVTYNFTLVAIGDGVSSASASISSTTQSIASGKYTMWYSHMHCTWCMAYNDIHIIPLLTTGLPPGELAVAILFPVICVIAIIAITILVAVCVWKRCKQRCYSEFCTKDIDSVYNHGQDYQQSKTLVCNHFTISTIC